MNGKVGVGVAKAAEVPSAIRKAINIAKKDMVSVNIVDGTIPHDSTGSLGASKVFMRPAPKGTGVISGGVMRLVFELAGIHNIVSKSLGSSSVINNAFAALDGLKRLKSLEEAKAERGVDLNVRSAK